MRNPQTVTSSLRSKVLAIVAASSVAVVATAGSAVASDLHTVTLNVDGVTQKVSGLSSTVNDVLAAAGVETSIHDVVLPAPTSSVSDGQTITVQRAHQVTVISNGKQSRQWAVGRSVHDVAMDVAQKNPGAKLLVQRDGVNELPLSDIDETMSITAGSTSKKLTVSAGQSLDKALKDAGVEVSPLDSVKAEPKAKGKLALSVSSVEREDVTVTETIDRKVTEIPDNTKYEGQKDVVTAGSDGEKKVRYAVESRDGKEIRRVKISEEIISQPTPETVKVGTKKLPDGLSPEDMAAGGPPNPEAAQAVARTLLGDFGFDDSQFGCLVTLWNHESGWRYNAGNPSSGAYGIPQSLPASKMSAYGSDYRTNPATQIKWGLNYIKGRYGNPCGALSHWQSNNWY